MTIDDVANRIWNVIYNKNNASLSVTKKFDVIYHATRVILDGYDVTGSVEVKYGLPAVDASITVDIIKNQFAAWITSLIVSDLSINDFINEDNILRFMLNHIYISPDITNITWNTTVPRSMTFSGGFVYLYTTTEINNFTPVAESYDNIIKFNEVFGTTKIIDDVVNYAKFKYLVPEVNTSTNPSTTK